MKLGRLVKKFAPLAVAVAASAVAGCDGMNVQINGADGVPFAELDMSGDAPTGVALGGPDNVTITTGGEFSIEIDGSDEAVEGLRFVNEDGMLAIGREGNASDDVATVNVTLPSVSTLGIGGSGNLTSDSLTGNADIALGGSGSATVTGIAADALNVALGGSGSVNLAGSAANLTLVIGGSGSAMSPDLEVENAEVNIGGSGSASFASDGNVEANIVGSGSVAVSGDATCDANTIGSGSLVCEPRE